MQSLTRRAAVFALLSIASLPACGDSNNGDNAPLDAAPAADAPLSPADLRTGSIAIMDTKVFIEDNGDEVLAAAGPVLSIKWSDTGVEVPELAFFEGLLPLSYCQVRVFDLTAGEFDRPFLDEGDVTITGTKLPMGVCAFDEAAGAYRCPLDSGAVPEAGAVTTNGDGTVTVEFTGEAPFADVQIVGAHVTLEGFRDAQAVNNGTFPIIGKTDTTLTVVHPTAVDTAVGAGVSYAILTGVEAVPVAIPGVQAGVANPADVDFLGGSVEAEIVTIEKSRGDVLDALSASVVPSGEGFTLDSDSAKPYAFPTTAAAMTFSCATDGACGETGSGISGLVLAGHTTDAEVEAGTFDMPSPTKKFAKFSCTAVGASSLTLPQGAVEAILGADPTRVKLNIMRATAVPADPSPIAVGHSLVGFTDIP